MWIDNVDVPEELIAAHQAGTLVLFVGAGASVMAPSSLPGFVTLTRQIVAESRISVNEQHIEGKSDSVLGVLEDEHGVPVHQRVKAIIETPGSAPNALHAAIVSLAAASPSIRIVTTNYDLHLSTALAAVGEGVPEYTGPALPLGDDFVGVVYLHGSLRRDPRTLVVTDADFGRAYLRDAWAARFLERMFARYTVLFIGYSHKDVVMTYLGRGLRPTTSRFVLTDVPENRDWRLLGITPVGYQRNGESHDQLHRALGEWAAWRSMGLLDHRQRAAELVAAAPPRVPADISYLTSVVADPETIGFFTQYARGADWLAWASGHPECQRLFDPAAQPTACTHQLAIWFAQHYVMQAEYTDAARSCPAEWCKNGSA